MRGIALIIVYFRFDDRPRPAGRTLASGRKSYPYGFEKHELNCSGRAVSVFCLKISPALAGGHIATARPSISRITKRPLNIWPKKESSRSFPATIPVSSIKMDPHGPDFVTVSACALNGFAPESSHGRIVFAGHSKGSYVASVAAGLAFKESLPLKTRRGGPARNRRS